MKKSSWTGFKELQSDELVAVTGGSENYFWEGLGYGLGAFMSGVGQGASERYHVYY